MKKPATDSISFEQVDAFKVDVAQKSCLYSDEDESDRDK